MRKRIRENQFKKIAFWQMMIFSILLLLIWVNEILDLSSLFFGIATTSLNIYRALALSTVVVVCAGITIGHTYIMQKRSIQGMLTICSFCGKIKIKENAWENIEHYVLKHSFAVFSHGMCPECHQNETSKEKEKERNLQKKVD